METGTQPSETGAIVLDPADDVAVLIAGVEAGAFVKVSGSDGPLSLTVRQTLPMGHKIALRALSVGSPVRKYGEVIGRLTEPVAPGDHVHIHNLASQRAVKKP
ncbi:UxaA family hydrolase [Microvirga sp. 3-52]|uniref:UxaA family hydrolase n=1 Tax=Microvirga sp. 3-52 TaxID=2792425 RepID=UPI001AD18F77|nr:UxaA family hydrolase [Microvirga sp. 3-52]MBO1909396.1 UxaA family hydrolase [Microvirga sp. 3-52]MBS7455452.1 UxaA family hydrolase [Microvirga sp. 3-52]